MPGKEQQELLLEENEGEEIVLEDIKKESETIRKRVHALTDEKMSPLISHYEKVISCQKALVAAVNYYHLPFGLLGNVRFSSEDSCLEKIEIKTNDLNNTLVSIQKLSSVQQLTQECEEEKRELSRASSSQNALAVIKTQEIITRLFNLNKKAEEAKAAIEKINLAELGKYFEKYRVKIAKDKPEHATHLAGLGTNLKQNIEKVFSNNKLSRDAKK